MTAAAAQTARADTREPFALKPTEPIAISAARPTWWLSVVEQSTREHREKRAERLKERGREVATEALDVSIAIREAEYDERHLYQFADPLRGLPGASPEIKRTLRRWDRSLAARTNANKRLYRADGELVPSWRKRVLEEAERRIQSRWHRQRANGQSERFARVARCGEEQRGVIVCRGCHQERSVVPERCGSHLLCLECREHRKRRERVRVKEARTAALKRVRRARLGLGQTRREPFTEKFLTLTCPHIPLDAGGPELQARIVRDAWRRFMNSLRNHWRRACAERGVHAKLALGCCVYVRAIEATTGRDELGHVHIHAWTLSPFVRVQVMRIMWGRALMNAGFPPELWPECAWREKYGEGGLLEELAKDPRAYAWTKRTMPHRAHYPNVNIKRVYGKHGELEDGKDLANELIKYLCKDLEGSATQPVLMPPGLFASVYRGLDSGRMLTASRKFWVKRRIECECCGAIHAFVLVRAEPSANARARAPPEQLALFAELPEVDARRPGGVQDERQERKPERRPPERLSGDSAEQNR